jgi:hypothetical protein
MCFTSVWPNIFEDQGHFSDPDFINSTHQREYVQFANNKEKIALSVWWIKFVLIWPFINHYVNIYLAYMYLNIEMVKFVNSRISGISTIKVIVNLYFILINLINSKTAIHMQISFYRSTDCTSLPMWSIWWPVQSVPITTKVVSSYLLHGELYSIQHYVIKFVSDLRQVGGYLRDSVFLHQ